MSNNNNNTTKESIKIVDMYEIHKTPDAFDLVQIFLSIDDREILQSMVITKKQLNELITQAQELLNK